jgi:hypothetical protein
MRRSAAKRVETQPVPGKGLIGVLKDDEGDRTENSPTDWRKFI